MNFSVGHAVSGTLQYGSDNRSIVPACYLVIHFETLSENFHLGLNNKWPGNLC